MHNLELRAVLNDTISLCKDIRSKVTSPGHPDYSDELGKQEYKKCIHEMSAMIGIVSDMISGKEKIPRNTEHLMHSVAAVTNSPLQFATMYLTARLKNNEYLRNYITTKHIRNVRRRRCRLKAFQPWNRDSAIYADYYGIPCKKCGSWCVTQHSTTGGLLSCAECGHVQKERGYPRCRSCQMPVYDDAARRMIKTKRKVCDACGADMDIPDSLLSI